MAKIRWLALAVLMGLGISAGLLVGRSVMAKAYEAPKYTVERQQSGWELRQYAPQIQARVTVRGTFDQAQSAGFRQLGGYIFGDNQPQETIEMTAPVEISSREGEKIKMTVPVETSPAGEGQWLVTFMMPAKWTLDTLPRPNNPNVELVEVPGKRMAALRFSGWADTTRAAAYQTQLLDALAQTDLTPTGEPIVAVYDGPWVLGPFRHNEILIPLQD